MKRQPFQEVNGHLPAAAPVLGKINTEAVQPQQHAIQQVLCQGTAHPVFAVLGDDIEHQDDVNEQQADEQDGEAAEEEQQEEEWEEGAWKQLLWDALSAATPPTRFACSGRLDKQPLPFLCPDITVAGVGRLSLPLLPVQAAAIKAVAEQAPHGRGLRTVVDTAVRDAYQVDASQVSIGSSWEPVLQRAVTEVSQTLGINDSTAGCIEARLYKLLLYEQGGHFSAHQDTEKDRGMVGTLVVQLPCEQGHSGGTLTVRHKARTHTHTFAGDSDHSLQYAAFFADCQHELSPITRGMRLVLVYNLVWVGEVGAEPKLLCKSPAEEQLEQALQVWEAELDRGGKQTRIAFLLEHQYTESNLRFEHLKGADRAMVRALSVCRGFDAHLVLVTRTVSGETDSPITYHKRRRCYWDEDDEDEDEDEGGHTIGEVLDDNTETGNWIGRDGSSVNYGSIDPETDIYHPDGETLFGEDDEPDDEHYEGYTGNAGPMLDQIYRRTLLVWPHSQTLRNATGAGFSALRALITLRMQEAMKLVGATLHAMQQQLLPQQQPHAAAAASAAANSLQQAHKDLLAALKASVRLLEKWLKLPAQQSYSYRDGSSSGQVTALLQECVKAVRLGTQGALKLVHRLLAAVASSAQPLLSDAALLQGLTATAAVLGAAVVGPQLQQLVSSCMALQPTACISLVGKMAGLPELQQQLASAAVTGAPASMVDGLLKLVLAVLDLPAVAQQVGGKLAAAMGGDSSAELAQKVVPLLASLEQLPALQQQLCAAAAAALCSAGPLKHIKCCVKLLQAGCVPRAVKVQVATAIAGGLSGSECFWHISEVLQLLPVLQDTEGTTFMVAANVAASLLGGTPSCGLKLSAQTDADMLQLSELLLQTPGLATIYFWPFSAQVARRPNNFGLLAQLLRSPAMQAASAAAACQQLVSDVCAALRCFNSAWQVTDAAAVTTALSTAPASQRTLQYAVVECIFTSSALLVGQSDSSMLQLSDMLLGNPQLRAAYYDHFTAAVLARPQHIDLVRQLLLTRLVRAHAAMPEIQQLVRSRIALLEPLAHVPKLSLRMPQAKMPSYPQVEAFLHGPDRQLTLRGFTGIAQARSTAAALSRGGHNGYGPGVVVTSTYSITMAVDGTGRNSKVQIRKTYDLHKRQVQAKEKYRQDLQAVRAMLTQ